MLSGSALATQSAATDWLESPSDRRAARRGVNQPGDIADAEHRALVVGGGIGQASQGRLVDALASRGDEGRDTLRKASGSCE